MFYHLLLIVHIAGFLLMAGTTLAECILFFPLRRHPAKATAVLPIVHTLSIALPIGAPLLLLSGAGLLWLTGGAFLAQRWMLVKLVLVALLPLNGFTIGLAQEKRLKANINAHTLRNMHLFYASQLLIFVIILVLAVFKFQ